MLRKLYHGSRDIIQQPVFGYGKKYNDYGLGFYCTENINMAKEWAATANQNGYANCYELDSTDLKVLDLNAEQFCILHWLTISLIIFSGYELAEHTEWFDKKNKRDKTARREYFSTERNKRRRGDIYITQIMDEEMKSDDARLR